MLEFQESSAACDSSALNTSSSPGPPASYSREELSHTPFPFPLALQLEPNLSGKLPPGLQDTIFTVSAFLNALWRRADRPGPLPGVVPSAPPPGAPTSSLDPSAGGPGRAPSFATLAAPGQGPPLALQGPSFALQTGKVARDRERDWGPMRLVFRGIRVRVGLHSGVDASDLESTAAAAGVGGGKLAGASAFHGHEGYTGMPLAMAKAIGDAGESGRDSVGVEGGKVMGASALRGREGYTGMPLAMAKAIGDAGEREGSVDRHVWLALLVSHRRCLTCT